MADEQKLIQLTMEQLDTVVKNAVSSAAKELGAGKVEMKHGVLPGTTDDEIKNWPKEKRINKFIRAVAAGDIATVKALAESTTTTGGYLVPEEFRLDILRVQEEYGLVRRLANVFPTSLDTINFAASNGENTVTWVAENVAITETTASFTAPTIAIEKMAGITALSRELFSDEKSNLIGFLSGVFGEDMAKKEDSACLVGTGAAGYGLITGLTSFATTYATAAVSGASSYKNFTADDWLNNIFQLTTGARVGGAYFCHPIVLSYLMQAKTSGSGAYTVQPPTQAGVPPSIWGYPIYTSETMDSTDAAATAFVGFGNMKRRLNFADRQQMTLTIGTEGTVGSNNLFEKDMLALRVTNRVGAVWTLESKLSLLKTN